MLQSSSPFLTRAHEDICCRDFSLHFPAPELHLLTLKHEEATCMTLRVDLFSTSAGFISSTRQHCRAHRRDRRLLGSSLSHPAGSPPRLTQLRKFPLAAEALTMSGTGAKFQLSPSVTNHQRAAGNTPRTGRHTHTQHTHTLTVDVPLLSIALAQLLHRNCKDSPAHTHCPAGSRSCLPLRAPGKLCLQPSV